MQALTHVSHRLGRQRRSQQPLAHVAGPLAPHERAPLSREGCCFCELSPPPGTPLCCHLVTAPPSLQAPVRRSTLHVSGPPSQNPCRKFLRLSCLGPQHAQTVLAEEAVRRTPSQRVPSARHTSHAQPRPGWTLHPQYPLHASPLHCPCHRRPPCMGHVGHLLSNWPPKVADGHDMSEGNAQSLFSPKPAVPVNTLAPDAALQDDCQGRGKD